jgi:Protein of unknown function (DUF4239)
MSEAPVMWFYQLPTWLTLPGFILLFVGASCGLLLAVRPWVRRVVERTLEWDRVMDHAITMYGVFYGITLALVAVSVFQNFIRVDQVVQDEVAALAAFYRSVSGFDQPTAGTLQDMLRAYTQHVISVDWPQQASGQTPTVGGREVDQIQVTLFSYQPTNPAQNALHEEAIGQFNDFVSARRYRINESRLALPALLWLLLWVGAAINQTLLALIEVKEVLVHLIIMALISLFVALLIYVTLQLDHPYYGAVTIDPTDFQVLLDDLMARR